MNSFNIFNTAKIAQKVRLIGGAVMFRHTLFSLPFAITAILLETNGHPAPQKVILILIAATAGRNAANALNRVIDADIDKKNERTSDRHIPRGALSKKALLVFAFVLCAVVAFAACMLNWLCAALLPAAAILIGGYSFSKRFTWLCHYWLGLACCCAVMGSFLALTGHFAVRYFVLALAHCLWVAGFDIIYALQDIAFDRAERLHSIPARFGAGTARIIAAVSHFVSIAALCMVPVFWNVSVIYLTAVCVSALLLFAEHRIALGKMGLFHIHKEHRIRIASYSINEIVPLVILLGTILDIYA
ncbi:MAG: putative 4-hydroxybenzoate polyprenyltransferase [Treponema sp.]|jgi:4-hydroxybenzoate polyprenyltransferase|nr:putative 4-hydroxybenzoate polyprenyltransferase [Treponema sp.]